MEGRSARPQLEQSATTCEGVDSQQPETKADAALAEDGGVSRDAAEPDQDASLAAPEEEVCSLPACTSRVELSRTLLIALELGSFVDGSVEACRNSDCWQGILRPAIEGSAVGAHILVPVSDLSDSYPEQLPRVGVTISPAEQGGFLVAAYWSYADADDVAAEDTYSVTVHASDHRELLRMSDTLALTSDVEADPRRCDYGPCRTGHIDTPAP